MDFYYVNKNAQPSGEHEVHKGSCRFLPTSENRIFLGQFANCSDAISKSKEYYTNVDGCYHCCISCHRR